MKRADALALVKATPMAHAALCIKTHRAAPIPRSVCCHDQIDSTAATPKSPEIDFRPMDMNAMRRALPDRWSHFCHTHFQDVEHLAAFMGVEVRTARYWWEGKHAPTGAVVLRAVTAFPDAAPCLTDGDC